MPMNTKEIIFSLRYRKGDSIELVSEKTGVSIEKIKQILQDQNNIIRETEDELTVDEVSELTGFSPMWIKRAIRKFNHFISPVRTYLLKTSENPIGFAVHLFNKDEVYKYCEVLFKMLLKSSDNYLQTELNPVYYEGYPYGYKRSFNTPKIQRVYKRFKALSSKSFNSKHWVGKLNYNNRLSHMKVMAEYRMPTSLTKDFKLNDYSQYEEEN
jgi:transcriptional regulator with XRE-family HTH domain|tara:strand:- start:101 stop:736 length:636 start_codon:yes stop_codon:yes gene_type:complete